jgi:hypothetical protein
MHNTSFVLMQTSKGKYTICKIILAHLGQLLSQTQQQLQIQRVVQNTKHVEFVSKAKRAEAMYELRSYFWCVELLTRGHEQCPK